MATTRDSMAVSATRDELSLDLYSRRSLLDELPMGALQSTLKERAPEWSRRLRFVEDEAKRTYSLPLDLTERTALFEAVKREVSTPPSPFFRELEQRFGSVGPRQQHDIQIAGSHEALMLFLRLDARPVTRIGRAWRFGNGLGFGLAGSGVDGQPAADWIPAVTSALAGPCSIDHGFARTRAEYHAKNMSTAGGGLRALGRDIGKYLPGLYWLNYFGELYCNLIGRDRLLSAPAFAVVGVGNGVLLRLTERPDDWQTSDGAATYREVLDHIGHEFFFDRDRPDRVTVAPDFGGDAVSAISN